MDRLQAMAVLVAVADEGGFAAAARVLNQSPAAVTRAIAGLEARIGTRLFTRTTRSVRLTDAGRRYLDDCRRILVDVAEAEDAAAGSHARPQGRLTVTAPTQFGRLHVGPKLPAFLERFPDVSVRTLFVDRVVNLVDEGVDVGIRIGDLEDSALMAMTVHHVRRVVVGAPAYLDHAGAPTHPRELRHHRLIAPTSLMRGNTWAFRDGGKTLDLHVASRLETSTPEVAIDAARQGYGLTQVPIYQVADDLASKRLVTVLDAFELPPLPVRLVSVEGRRAAAKVRAFADFMAASLRRDVRAD